MSGSTAVADFVARSRVTDCPGPAMAAARRAIFDCLGLMLAGARMPAARILQWVAQAEGGAPLCTIVGTGRRTGALWAALCNGTAAHALDVDDTNFPFERHSSAPLLAAALAAAELALSDGVSLIHAFLVGFEIQTTLALIDRDRGATGTQSAVGTAAAASRLLGLDVTRIRIALAVAASLSSASKEHFGVVANAFHAGHAARDGVLAALLAREGLSVSEPAFEGPDGFFNVFERERPRWEALATLGAPWKILSPGVAVDALSAGALRGTFDERARHVLTADRAESVAQMLDGLESCPDVRSLTAILGP